MSTRSRCSSFSGGWIAMALVLATAACEADVQEDPPGQPGGGTGTVSADQGPSAVGGSHPASSAGSAGASSVPAPPTVRPFPGDAAPCEPGEPYECRCPDGASGVMACIAANGGYSACGCQAEPVYPGETCGDEQCPFLTVDGGEFTAAHCCTADDRCGMKNTSVFADTCYPRFAEHYGERAESCDQPIPFVETRGCCRPDNRCGLVLLAGSNWDELGCVEATDLAQRMKQSLTLSLFLVGLGHAGALDRIEPRACSYAGGKDGSYDPVRHPM